MNKSKLPPGSVPIPHKNSTDNRLPFVSLCCGVLSFLGIFISWQFIDSREPSLLVTSIIFFILALLAIIFGVMGRKTKFWRSIATKGLILGIIDCCLCLLLYLPYLRPLMLFLLVIGGVIGIIVILFYKLLGKEKCCSECGSALEEGEKFCTNCGKQIT
jgi:hypothetical protein